VTVDRTHDATLQSWVESANDPASDFPIQNLPFGVFRRKGKKTTGVGVAIGDRILDLAACAKAGLLSKASSRYADRKTLKTLMSAGPAASRALRKELVALLNVSNKAAAKKAKTITLAMKDADLLLPARVGNYSDFYASIHHATNVGTMLRPDNPLLPNYKWVPIGYHGRASSIVVSGTRITRPSGQTRDDPNAPPSFGPSRRLDYEAEIGAFIGPANALGKPVPLGKTDDHIFGLCLVNDWSARDMQTWEYQPLGPFLAKSFATSVSPWVVTLDALAPFRVASAARAADDPQPLPYLADASDRKQGAIDVTVEMWLSSARMRAAKQPAMLVSRGSLRDLYWTLGQMLAHHTSNGCNMQPGDLIASGTISGREKEQRGCLLERTWRGTEPLQLPSGERRAFLEDGDEVTMRGYAEREGFRRIGFGECRGTILPST
jgi:fumarylacetoacetase